MDNAQRYASTYDVSKRAAASVVRHLHISPQPNLTTGASVRLIQFVHKTLVVLESASV